MDPNSSAPRPSADAEKDLRTVLTPTDDRTILVGGAGVSAGGSPVVLPAENYKVGSEIARGGMGAILEAEDRKLGRKVAMKVMRLEVDASEDQRQRFIREATVLARLEHPNIVPIHDLGRDAQGRLFYTMKLVHGQTLQAILNSLKSGDAAATQHYTLDRLLTVFRKVCDALSLAHARGVIHRDLKPENVMVGEFGEVLLMDWGIAKVMAERSQGDGSPFLTPDSRPLTPGHTLAGSIMGTPQYMSPEQADGRLDDIDQRSDVFSLGGILYAILTLRAPVDGTTVDEVLRNIRTGAIRTPTEFNTVQAMARGKRARRGAIPRPEQFFPLRHCPSERVPSALAAVAMKALAVKKRDRYATVAEFAADIEAYQGGYATSAERAGLGTQLMLLVKRNKILSTSAALLVALSVVFTVRVVKERNRVKQALVEADQQRQLAQDSLAEAEKQRRLAEESLLDQQRQTVRLTMNEAMNLCERGEVGRGLQSMVRALKVAVEIGDREQERIIRLNLGAWSHVNHELLLAWRPPPPSVMRAVAFSPDGKRLLTTGFRNTAQLWEPATGKPVGPVMEHGNAVLAVAFSGDGKVMATGSRDRTARMWDVATGKPRGEPIVHMAEVFSLALNHDGSRLITGSFDEKPPAVGPHRPRRAQVWDTVSGTEVCPPLKWAGRNWRGYLWPLTISPDGKTAFTGVADWDAQFWDVTTGKPLGKPISTLNRTSSRWFLAACFSPDGTKLATGASDYALRLWDVKTQMPIGEPMFHPDYVTALAFSPDGTEIVSGAKDQAVRIWNVATGRQAGPSLMQGDQVDFVSMGPNGKTVWTGSRDGASARDPIFRCWAVGGERPLTPPLIHANEVWHAHFLPDAKTMITTTETDVVYWWDIATGKKTGEKKVPGGGHIHASALSRDGKMLAVGTCAGWSGGHSVPAELGGRLTVGDMVIPQFLYKNVVWNIAVSRDGTRAIIGGKSKTAQVFDVATAMPVGAPMKHTDEVTRVALSPDGKIALTGGDDRIARLWDTATGKPLCDPLPHDEAVRAAAFSPDGRTFVTANGPNLWFWDTATRERTGTPLQLDEYVQRAEFSPDGKLIVTVGERATITWDVASGNRLGPPLPHAGAAYAEFSRDGSRIATCGRDKTARVWLAPRSADGAPEKIALWVDTITGTESDERGAIHALASAEWLQRRAQLVASGGAPLPALMTMPVPANEKRIIDLLAIADVKLDAITGSAAKPGQPGGNWQRTKDAIRSPGREGSRLDLPVLITGDYRLRMRFTMREGVSALDVPFPVGDRMATLIFGAGKRNGLELLNHLTAEADGNPTRIGDFKLDRDKPHDLLITVKHSGSNATIEVMLDDKKLIEWTGPHTAFDPELRGYRRGILGLKPWATVIDFYQWEVEFLHEPTAPGAR